MELLYYIFGRLQFILHSPKSSMCNVMVLAHAVFTRVHLAWALFPGDNIMFMTVS